MEQVAVITGANSGVGFALAKRLLSEVAPGIQFRLCLACRNPLKGETAKRDLLREYPHANIDLLQVDTNIPQSSIDAAREIIKRYKNGIRWFYCNAGIMPLGGTNWRIFMSLKTKKDWISLFTTGSGINIYSDWTTEDGLQAVFATNVLGHYLMIKEMEDYLIDQTQHCHIIWTSSNAASTVEIDPSDIQSKKRDASYPNSKRLADVLSLDINRRLNTHGIYSDTVCPGMVVSQITLAILPYFFWILLLPVIFLIRVFITHFITFSASNGAESLVWLAKQSPSELDHSLKYFSRKPPFGKTYVLKEKIPCNDVLLNNTIASLNTVSTPYLQNET